jgi:hypothetical protein
VLYFLEFLSHTLCLLNGGWCHGLIGNYIAHTYRAFDCQYTAYICNVWLFTVHYTYRAIDWLLSCMHTGYLIGPYPVHIQNILICHYHIHIQNLSSVSILYTYRAADWSIYCTHTEQLPGKYAVHIQSSWLVNIYATHTGQLMGHNPVQMHCIWCCSLQQNTNHCFVSTEWGCLEF